MESYDEPFGYTRKRIKNAMLLCIIGLIVNITFLKYYALTCAVVFFEMAVVLFPFLVFAARYIPYLSFAVKFLKDR